MPPSRPATSIPNNLFVTGGSGGGVLTAWIVGKTDRFRRRGDAEAGDQLDQLRADHRLRRRFFARYWSARSGRGRTRRAIGSVRRSAWSATSRRRPWSSSAARIIAPPSARPSNIMPRCSCAACRRRWSRCRARATAASPRGRARRRPRRAAILAWFDRYRRKAAPVAPNEGLPPTAH